VASAYIPEIAYFLFNVSGQHGPRDRALRDQVAALLRLKMWGVDAGERIGPHWRPVTSL
jgi:hypothetical protein